VDSQLGPPWRGWRLLGALIGALLAAAMPVTIVGAQPSPDQTTAPEAPAPPQPPPAGDAAAQAPPIDSTAAAAPVAPSPDQEAAPKPAAKPQTKTAAAPVPPPKPPEPPKPLRSPVAILQALDKVTAETLRFAAPVGRRIRYKTLVFTVKACETSGIDDPQPSASAYLVIESEPRSPPGAAPLPAKQVYKGWMSAIAPGLHPFEHPVYDAWLIACSASTPPA